MARRRVVVPLELVLPRERAAADDWNLHRLEIAVTGVVEERRRRLRARRWRPSFDVDRAATGEIAHRRREGDRRRRNIAPRADPAEQFVVERVGPRFVVADLARIEAHGDQMIGVEAEIDVLRRRERLCEERGDGEQRERAGDLADDERAAKPLTVASL